MKDDAPTQPTLRTIAEISGLAIPTVSRALSDAPDIGKKTKERVKKIAEEIGYVPNRAGLRLKTGKTNVIALVLSTDHGIVNRSARLIASAAGALRGTRYHLNVTPYFPGEDVLVPIKYIVETKSADAIILNQTEPDDPRVEYLMRLGFPFVTHGRTGFAEQHRYYDFDNYAFTEQAVKLMATKNRRRLLAIAPPEHQTYSQHIRAALQDCGVRYGIKTGVLQGATSDDPDDHIFTKLKQCLGTHPDIDCLLAASTPAAMYSTAAIEAIGKSVGKHIDLVGKETTPLLHLFRPAIITYFEDITKAGQYLAEAAIRAVEAPNEPIDQFLEVPTLADFLSGQEYMNDQK